MSRFERITIALAWVVLVIAGAYHFTHHVVIEQNTCHQTADGLACRYHYEGNK